MERDVLGENMIQSDEGRTDGPRWAEVQQESLRTQQADALARWCRRAAGFLVWGFVAVIFSQLWQVAWELQDLKLLSLCLLITLSIFYVFYKRYLIVRQSGLTGVDLVRALAVDEGEHARMRGVTTKARAACVDFKFDPDAEFRENALGCGFEPYPLRPLSSYSAPSLPSPGIGGPENDKGSSTSLLWRHRVRWPWGWGDHRHETLPDQGFDNSDLNGDSRTSSMREAAASAAAGGSLHVGSEPDIESGGVGGGGTGGSASGSRGSRGSGSRRGSGGR